MPFSIRFSVFSSNQVQGSGREVLGTRALVDVLEERRLLSAAVDEGMPAYEGTVGAIEATLDAGAGHGTPVRSSGLEFGKGDGSPIEIGGTNGPQTFGAARIDDGSGRDNLHGSGAVLEWIEPVEADDAPTFLAAPAPAHVAGRFSTGRVLTGNMSPVATMAVAAPSHVFAA